MLPVALLGLLIPIPAQAVEGSWRSSDPSGDVTGRAFSPEPPPCGTVTYPEVTEGDITRVDVRHRPASVKVAVRLAGATPVEGMQLTVPVQTSRRHFLVILDGRKGRLRGGVEVVGQIDDDDIDVDECGNESYSFGTFGPRCRVVTTAAPRLLTLVIPRKCIGDPRWVRVGAELGGGDDAMWHLDRWAPADYDDTKWWIHTYGPRVRVSR
jgi:hypothetical protein